MENKRLPFIVAGAAVLVAAAAALWYFNRPAPPAEPQVAQAPPVPEAKPPDAPPPPPDKNDEQIRQQLAGLSQRPEWARWLAASNLLDRFVVVVDNVAEDVNPRKQLDFIQVEPLKGDKWDPTRYDQIGAVIGSIDAKGLAQIIRDVHPLLESAYRKLGYPDRKFDDVAAKALQRIIAAPVRFSTPQLVPKGANLAFANENLEALGPVEKLLLRMGPMNAKILQTKARQLATALDYRVAQH